MGHEFEPSVSSIHAGTLHMNTGPFKNVNQFIAEIHGASEARVTSAGTSSLNSTVGQYIRHVNQPMAICSNAHMSIINAICVNEFDPYLVPVYYDPIFEIVIPSTPEDIKKLFEENQDVGFVILTSPTYEGVYAKTEEIAAICHNNGAICVLDSAWDHFPNKIPKNVDIMVKSTHKLEGADQGGAILLWQE
jgi:arginine/lysine/ornithine decarboxylase